VVVPAGSFTIGSPESEKGRDADEGPQHRVTVAKPFAVGKYEVTVRQFGAFAQATNYDMSDGCWDHTGNEWNASNSWRSPGFEQTERDPVVCVSWWAAKAYVEWLSRETAEPYRLLSEAEWE